MSPQLNGASAEDFIGPKDKDPGWIKNGDKKNGLPEAPASATVRVWVEDYGVLLTMRGDQVGPVVKQVEWMVDYAKKKGWKPSWKEEKKATQTFKCSECGADAEYKEGKSAKSGKDWKGVFCSENKDHVKWLS